MKKLWMRWFRTRYQMKEILKVMKRLERSIQELEMRTRRESIMNSAQLQEEVVKVLRIFQLMEVVGRQKRRYGRSSDGGYVLLDDFSQIDAVVALGVGKDVSWDLAMAKLNLPIYQFDHSVDHAPEQHPAFVFSKTKIAPKTNEKLNEISLLSVLEKNHIKSAVLKCDIESAEWDVLDQCPIDALLKFKQIICEFHDLDQMGDCKFKERARRVFAKLNEHYALIHAHANNHGRFYGSMCLPADIELTFVMRRSYELQASYEKLPGPLDFPNWHKLPDGDLNTVWPSIKASIEVNGN